MSGPRLVLAKTKAINADGVSVMVEQKTRQCLTMADYAYGLGHGRNRLARSGPALIGNTDVVRLYLGARRVLERSG